MKHLAWICVFCLWSLISGAQQDAQFSNFLFNSYWFNPAVAGINECLDIRAGYRTQWVGFEDQPITATLTVNGRIKKWSQRKRGPIHGVGMVVESDNVNVSSRTFINVSYAIHLPLNRKTRLAVGFHAGIFQYRFDAARLRARQPGDPALQGSGTAFLVPDLTPGVWLYSDDWFAGLSYRHAFPLNIDPLGEDNPYQPSLNLLGGLILGNPKEMSYVPAILVKNTGNSKPAIDVNFWADYRNVFALGVGYRTEDALIGMLKVNFLQYFTLSYAYDFTVSNVRFGSANTHEIMVGFVACPRTLRQGFVPCAAYD